MATPPDYERLLERVRSYGLGTDDVYDFNGAAHALLAALDNLRQGALAAEFGDIGQSMTDAQRQFLRRIAGVLAEQDRTDSGDDQQLAPT